MSRLNVKTGTGGGAGREVAEQDERGEDGEAGGREGGKERRTEDRTAGEADTINFVPISELGFVPTEASLLLLQGRTSNLLQLFPQYYFAARHWVFHTCGV